MTLVWTSVSMLGRAVAHTLMDSLYKYLPSGSMEASFVVTELPYNSEQYVCMESI